MSQSRLYLKAVVRGDSWGGVLHSSDAEYLEENRAEFEKAGFTFLKPGQMSIELQGAPDNSVILPIPLRALLAGTPLATISKPTPWVVPPKEMDVSLAARAPRPGMNPTTVVAKAGPLAEKALLYAGFQKTPQGSIYLASKAKRAFKNHHEMFSELYQAVRIAAEVMGIPAGRVLTTLIPSDQVSGLVPLDRDNVVYSAPVLSQPENGNSPSELSDKSSPDPDSQSNPSSKAVVEPSKAAGVDEFVAAIRSQTGQSGDIAAMYQGDSQKMLVLVSNGELSQVDVLSEAEVGYDVNTRISFRSGRPVEAKMFETAIGRPMSLMGDSAVSQWKVFNTQFNRDKQPIFQVLAAGSEAVAFVEEVQSRPELLLVADNRERQIKDELSAEPVADSKPVMPKPFGFNYLGEEVYTGDTHYLLVHGDRIEFDPVGSGLTIDQRLNERARFLVIDPEAASSDTAAIILSGIVNQIEDFPAGETSKDLIQKHIEPIAGDPTAYSDAMNRAVGAVVGMLNSSAIRSELEENLHSNDESFGELVRRLATAQNKAALKSIAAAASDAEEMAHEEPAPEDDSTALQAAKKLLERVKKILTEEDSRRRAEARSAGNEWSADHDHEKVLRDVIATDITVSGKYDSHFMLQQLLGMAADRGDYPFDRHVALQLEKNIQQVASEDKLLTDAPTPADDPVAGEGLDLLQELTGSSVDNASTSDNQNDYSTNNYTVTEADNESKLVQNDEETLAGKPAGDDGEANTPRGAVGDTAEPGSATGSGTVDSGDRPVEGEGDQRDRGLGDGEPEIHAASAGESGRSDPTAFLVSEEAPGALRSEQTITNIWKMALAEIQEGLGTVSRVTAYKNDSIYDLYRDPESGSLLVVSTGDKPHILLGKSINDEPVYADENGVRKYPVGPNLVRSEKVLVTPHGPEVRNEIEDDHRVISPISLSDLELAPDVPEAKEISDFTVALASRVGKEKIFEILQDRSQTPPQLISDLISKAMGLEVVDSTVKLELDGISVEMPANSIPLPFSKLVYDDVVLTAASSGNILESLGAGFQIHEENNPKAQEPLPAKSSKSEPYGVGMERHTHVTKKRNRELVGVIDHDISMADAREIDQYAFWKDGGIFIRDTAIEAYNDNLLDESSENEVPAAPAEVEAEESAPVVTKTPDVTPLGSEISDGALLIATHFGLEEGDPLVQDIQTSLNNIANGNKARSTIEIRTTKATTEFRHFITKVEVGSEFAKSPEGHYKPINEKPLSMRDINLRELDLDGVVPGHSQQKIPCPLESRALYKTFPESPGSADRYMVPVNTSWQEPLATIEDASLPKGDHEVFVYGRRFGLAERMKSSVMQVTQAHDNVLRATIGLHVLVGIAGDTKLLLGKNPDGLWLYQGSDGGRSIYDGENHIPETINYLPVTDNATSVYGYRNPNNNDYILAEPLDLASLNIQPAPGIQEIIATNGLLQNAIDSTVSIAISEGDEAALSILRRAGLEFETPETAKPAPAEPQKIEINLPEKLKNVLEIKYFEKTFLITGKTAQYGNQLGMDMNGKYKTDYFGERGYLYQNIVAQHVEEALHKFPDPETFSSRVFNAGVMNMPSFIESIESDPATAIYLKSGRLPSVPDAMPSMHQLESLKALNEDLSTELKFTEQQSLQSFTESVKLGITNKALNEYTKYVIASQVLDSIAAGFALDNPATDKLTALMDDIDVPAIDALRDASDGCIKDHLGNSVQISTNDVEDIVIIPEALRALPLSKESIDEVTAYIDTIMRVVRPIARRAITSNQVKDNIQTMAESYFADDQVLEAADLNAAGIAKYIANIEEKQDVVLKSGDVWWKASEGKLTVADERAPGMAQITHLSTESLQQTIQACVGAPAEQAIKAYHSGMEVGKENYISGYQASSDDQLLAAYSNAFRTQNGIIPRIRETKRIIADHGDQSLRQAFSKISGFTEEVGAADSRERVDSLSRALIALRAQTPIADPDQFPSLKPMDIRLSWAANRVESMLDHASDVLNEKQANLDRVSALRFSGNVVNGDELNIRIPTDTVTRINEILETVNTDNAPVDTAQHVIQITSDDGKSSWVMSLNNHGDLEELLGYEFRKKQDALEQRYVYDFREPDFIDWQDMVETVAISRNEKPGIKNLGSAFEVRFLPEITMDDAAAFVLSEHPGLRIKDIRDDIADIEKVTLDKWSGSQLPADEIAEKLMPLLTLAKVDDSVELVDGGAAKLTKLPGLSTLELQLESGEWATLPYTEVFGDEIGKALSFHEKMYDWQVATEKTGQRSKTLMSSFAPFIGRENSLKRTAFYLPRVDEAINYLVSSQYDYDGVTVNSDITPRERLLADDGPVAKLIDAVDDYLGTGEGKHPFHRMFEVALSKNMEQADGKRAVSDITFKYADMIVKAWQAGLPVLEGAAQPSIENGMTAKILGQFVGRVVTDTTRSYMDGSYDPKNTKLGLDYRAQILLDEDGEAKFLSSAEADAMGKIRPLALNGEVLGNLWYGVDVLRAIPERQALVKQFASGNDEIDIHLPETVEAALAGEGWLPLRENQEWPKIKGQATAHIETKENPSTGKAEPAGVRISTPETAPQTVPVKNLAEAKQNIREITEPQVAVPVPVPRSEEHAALQDTPDDNFEISDDIAAGGAVAHYQANMAAIELLTTLRQEGRLNKATASEKDVLSRFVGWGGLPQAFERPKGGYAKGWEERGEALKSILSEDEYRSAAKSTLNAHFTSVTIVDSIYSALAQMGVKGNARYIEPAAGSGNFIGRMPESLRKHAAVEAIELETITGDIAKTIYGSDTVKVHSGKGYEKYHGRQNTFDVAIGNPPFGNYRIFDPKLPQLSSSIHNFFMLKSLHLLRPGGIQAFVISRYFMDSKDTKVREKIAKNAALVGAIRLPETAFEQNAGTSVVTDIIFLQKREAELTAIPEEDADWVFTTSVEVEREDMADPEAVTINRYFADKDNAEMILGKPTVKTGMYRSGLTYTDTGEDLQVLLSNAIKRLPEGIYNPDRAVNIDEILEVTSSGLRGSAGVDTTNLAVGTMFVHDDTVYVREPDIDEEFYAEPVRTRRGANGKELALSNVDYDRLKGLVTIRSILDKLLDAEIEGKNEELIDELRLSLNGTYDSFRKKFGPVNRNTNTRLIRQDPSYIRIVALEKDYKPAIKAGNKAGKPVRAESAEKADIFHERVAGLNLAEEMVAENPKDALALSLRERGGVDIGFMKELLEGVEEADILNDLGNDLFKDPLNDQYVWGPLYLSGNVRKKLKQAETAAIENPAYLRNVEALMDNQPETIPFEKIHINMGSHWLPKSILSDYIREKAGDEKLRVSVVFNSVEGIWKVDFKTNPTMNNDWSTDRTSATDIFNAALSNKAITIKDRVLEGSKEVYVVNEKATMQANSLIDKLKLDFTTWTKESSDRIELLERNYNEKVNVTVRPNIKAPDGYYPRNMVPESVFKARPHQLNYVFRGLMQSNISAVHFAGAGKTASEIMLIMEQIRVGQIRKALLPVPNHLTGQWAVAVQQLYPQARILVPEKTDFQKANREKMFARIATGNYDMVIIGHSQLAKLPIDYQIQVEFLNDEMKRIEQSIGELDQDERYTLKRLEADKERLKNKLEVTMSAMDNAVGIQLGQMNVDKIAVDEAHNFKNLGFATKLQVSGLGNPKGSQKAFNMLVHMEHVNKIGGAKSTLSATPLSNSIAEMYAWLRYNNPTALQDRDIHTFDAFINLFGEITNKLELTLTGDSYKIVSRLARFNNVQELLDMYLEVADCVSPQQVKQAILDAGGEWFVPGVRNGGENIVVPQTPAQIEIFEELRTRMALLDDPTQKVDPTEDNKLKVLSDASKAALHPRAFDPDVDELYIGKLKSVVEGVGEEIKIMQDRFGMDGLHIVFCDLGVPKGAIAREREILNGIMNNLDSEDEAIRLQAEKDFDKYSPDEVTSILDDNAFGFQDAMRTAMIDRLNLHPDRVASLHDCRTDDDRLELYRRCNAGEVSVLFATTSKGGEGMNVARYVAGVVDVDAPWRPSDLEQRRRRAERQGNWFFEQDSSFEVYNKRYATERSTDSWKYQTLESKALGLNGIIYGNAEGRSVEEVSISPDDLGAMKALSSGDDLVRKQHEAQTRAKNIAAEIGIQKDRAASHNRQVKHYKGVLADIPGKISAAEAVMAVFSNYPDKVQVVEEDEKSGKPVKKERAALHVVMHESGKEFPDAMKGGQALAYAIMRFTHKRHYRSDYPLGTVNGLNLTMDYYKGAWGDTVELNVIEPEAEKLVAQISIIPDEISPKTLGNRIRKACLENASKIALLERDYRDAQTSLKQLEQVVIPEFDESLPKQYEAAQRESEELMEAINEQRTRPVKESEIVEAIENTKTSYRACVGKDEDFDLAFDEVVSGLQSMLEETRAGTDVPLNEYNQARVRGSKMLRVMRSDLGLSRRSQLLEEAKAAVAAKEVTTMVSVADAITELNSLADQNPEYKDALSQQVNQFESGSTELVALDELEKIKESILSTVPAESAPEAAPEPEELKKTEHMTSYEKVCEMMDVFQQKYSWTHGKHERIDYMEKSLNDFIDLAERMGEIATEKVVRVFERFDEQYLATIRTCDLEAPVAEGAVTALPSDSIESVTDCVEESAEEPDSPGNMSLF